MVETNNQTSFDANYKAIICYNLACCCQMQGELQDCSTYLTKAIEFVNIKLDGIKQNTIAQFQALSLSSQSAGSNSQIDNSGAFDLHTMTITNSTVSANHKKPIKPAPKVRKSSRNPSLKGTVSSTNIYKSPPKTGYSTLTLLLDRNKTRQSTARDKFTTKSQFKQINVPKP
jgi:hypothetical protein